MSDEGSDVPDGLHVPSIDSQSMEALRLYARETIGLLELEEKDDCLWDGPSGIKRRSVYKHLVVCDSSITPYGHMSVEFVLCKKIKDHKILVNDAVALRLELPNQRECSGIVTYSSFDKIIVQFDQTSLYAPIEGLGFTLRIKRDIITNNKMKEALRSLLIDPIIATDIINIRFGVNEITNAHRSTVIDSADGLLLDNLKLTELQTQAVAFAIANKLTVVHGPPGTGKTSTLVEIVYQLAKCGKKILICTPSNTALDSIVEKLSKFGISMVRLGHAARIKNANVKRYSVDALLANEPSFGMIKEVRKEINTIISEIASAKGRGNNKTAKLKSLLDELQTRESKALNELLSKTQLICSTLTTADPKGAMKELPRGFFDAVIIDECSQALEPMCWIAIPWANKWILAGDHHQLAPFVSNKEACMKGLQISLMEKLVKKHGDEVCVTLRRQFRMNAKIMRWVSKEFYDGKLVADPTVANHLLADLPGVDCTSETNSCLIFVNTSGCRMGDYQDSTKSYVNVGEAEITVIMAKKLLEAGVSPCDIAVITPYRQQVETVTRSRSFELPPEVEVHTVDGFQGREKEAIILSFVRSNECHQTGFVGDRCRTNVAVSRARRWLCVIGDATTLCKDPVLNSLVQHIKDEGDTLSAFELLGDLSYNPNQKNICEDKRRISVKPKANHFKAGSVQDVGFRTPTEDNVGSTTTASRSSTKSWTPFMDMDWFNLLQADMPLNNAEASTPSAESAPTVTTDPEAKHGAIKKDTGKRRTKRCSKKSPQSTDENASKPPVDSDLEEFLDKCIEVNRTCRLAGCHERVSLIYFDCQLCGNRYCIRHSLPEVHGCALEAKKAAKKKFLHPVRKEIDEATKKQLQAKIEKKLSTFSKGRKPADGKHGPK